MALSLARISPPCRVIFAGLEGDTFSMSRQGWDIAVEEDPYRGNIRLLLNHKQAGLQGMAENRGGFFAPDWRMRGGDLPIFFVSRMAGGMRVVTNSIRSFENYSLADMTPSFAMVEEVEIARLPLFAEAKRPPAEELIVDPATVSELLDRIRSQQAPIQKDIRERARRREIIPVQHASIYTLPIAA